MSFSRLKFRILLLLGFAALFAFIMYREQIKGLFIFGSDRVKATADNFFDPSASQVKRRRPVSLLERETELQLYIGEPFRDFNKQDWEWFWDLLYGVFPKDAPEREGLPKKYRQLTTGEIADQLIERYPQPFFNFTESNWQMFFQVAFKK